MSIEDIHRICKKYKIENYTINDDLSIDVDGNVYFNLSDLKSLPLRFRNVIGNFTCSFNDLKTLEGVPSSVSDSFYCSHNNLKSLEGAPSSVGGSFYCDNNSLTSLKGIPLNLSEKQLSLPDHFTYSDYLAYFRDLKFKKLLK